MDNGLQTGLNDLQKIRKLFLRSGFLIYGLWVWLFSLDIYGETLDEYVRTAIRNNPALKQKEFSVKRSSAALKEAGGMFCPSVSLDARYSRAGGGRTLFIPVGDLMNPVYRTLNQLISQSEDFPFSPVE